MAKVKSRTQVAIDIVLKVKGKDAEVIVDEYGRRFVPTEITTFVGATRVSFLGVREGAERGEPFAEDWGYAVRADLPEVYRKALNGEEAKCAAPLRAHARDLLAKVTR